MCSVFFSRSYLHRKASKSIGRVVLLVPVPCFFSFSSAIFVVVAFRHRCTDHSPSRRTANGPGGGQGVAGAALRGRRQSASQHCVASGGSLGNRQSAGLCAPRIMTLSRKHTPNHSIVFFFSFFFVCVFIEHSRRNRSSCGRWLDAMPACTRVRRITPSAHRSRCPCSWTSNVSIRLSIQCGGSD